MVTRTREGGAVRCAAVVGRGQAAGPRRALVYAVALVAFMAEDGAFMAEDGAFMAEDGAFMAEDGAFMAAVVACITASWRS